MPTLTRHASRTKSQPDDDARRDLGARTVALQDALWDWIYGVPADDPDLARFRARVNVARAAVSTLLLDVYSSPTVQ